MTPRWKIVLGAVVLALLFIFALTFRHFNAKGTVASYKKQLIAKGEKLAIAEWIPPASAKSEEAGNRFLESIKPVSGINRFQLPQAMRAVAPGRAEVGWRAEGIFNFPDRARTGKWRTVQETFEQNSEATAELQAALAGGEIIFPVDYTQGSRASLPHLASVRQASGWLSGATLLQLHEGNKNAAGENLESLLRLAGSYEGEPLLISQLFRATCIQMAFNATWEALQFPDWSDRELEQFQQAWGRVKFNKTPEDIFSMERAMGIHAYDEVRRSPELAPAFSATATTASLLDDLSDFASAIVENPVAAFKGLLFRPNRRAWKFVQSYEEELFMLKIWQAGLETMRGLEKGVFYAAAMKQLDAEFASFGPEQTFLLGDSRSMIRTAVVRRSSAELAKQIALAACALQRYKLDANRYPETLTQLIPKYLPEIPLDLMDGQPLRYRLNKDGTFLLYSVGENGVDEAGNAEREIVNGTPVPEPTRGSRTGQSFRGRDWVWPQPATEEQIKNWEEEESKRVR